MASKDVLILISGTHKHAMLHSRKGIKVADIIKVIFNRDIILDYLVGNHKDP